MTDMGLHHAGLETRLACEEEEAIILAETRGKNAYQWSICKNKPICQLRRFSCKPHAQRTMWATNPGIFIINPVSGAHANNKPRQIF